MNENDPILEAALEEVLGGKTPPDLIAQTLAKANALNAAPPKQPVAGPRPAWRAWGPGLAAAAAILLTATVAWLGLAGTQSEVEFNAVSQAVEPALNDVSTGAEDSSGGQYDQPLADITLAPYEEWKRSVDASGNLKLAVTPFDEVDGDQPRNMKFDGVGSNPFVDTEDDRLSTFALEHDTGSYAIARQYLNGGNLPPDEAIRVEEFVNYFDYDYYKPAIDPFSITMDAAPSRYGQDLHNCYLMRVGVQAREIPAANRKPAVLTFVIDVSGSMEGEQRLGLVKRALEMLVNELREGDKVGIAVFGSRGYEYMGYKDAFRKDEILKSIRGLSTEGSTNAAEGLNVAYEMAARNFREGYTNRVILCSDGVANVGETQAEAILKAVAENRRKGITLSTIGFGMGNYDDTFMEQLGDKGDGHYAYVDSIEEAKRTFVDNLTGALEVVGRDVKIQIEFNPSVVKSYRLIGYVNRDVKDEDFRNDLVDGGEIGAGHAATALYEVKLVDGATGPVAYATIRFKHDENEEAQEISRELFAKDIAGTWESADKDLRLAGSVAEFAEILGASFYAKKGSLKAVLNDLESMQYDFRNDKVTELIKLVEKANELK
ncbi:MAG: von Willebrand factor type A domain-containing protein [Planctomycetes bacterium]|nr:von Willebrand factor type A domain-containing protein [Planctomycetota bacterium]